MSEYLMRLEKIVWLDSYGATAGWASFEDLEKDVAMECTSVGYVLKESDKYLHVVPHWHGEISDGRVKTTTSGCGDMAIPRVAVISRSVLVERDGHE